MPKLNPFARDVAAQYLGGLMVALTLSALGVLGVLALVVYTAVRPDTWPDRDDAVVGIVVFALFVFIGNEYRRAMVMRSEAVAQDARIEIPAADKFVGNPETPYYGGSDVDIRVVGGDPGYIAERGPIVAQRCTIRQGKRVIVRNLQAQADKSGTPTFRVPRKATARWEDGYAIMQVFNAYSDGSELAAEPRWIAVRKSL